MIMNKFKEVSERLDNQAWNEFFGGHEDRAAELTNLSNRYSAVAEWIENKLYKAGWIDPLPF